MDNYKRSLSVLNRRLIHVKVFSIVLIIGFIYLFGIVVGAKWNHAIVVGILLGLIVFFCFHFKYAVEHRALANYIRYLEEKDRAGAIDWGRKYYAIKRMGFGGIRSKRVLAEDERAIHHDIQVYLEEK